MQWRKYFKDEQNLLMAMMAVDVQEYKRRMLNGFAYIEGFQRYFKKHGRLTIPQMTQLKRLAQEIFKYHTFYDEVHRG